MPVRFSLSHAAAGSGANNLTFDLVVYGATASGIATAVSGAREGLSVAMLDPGAHVGGMVTGGLGATDYGNKACLGGFCIEFYERLGKHYGEPLGWRPEPHVAEKVFNEIIAAAGVKLFLQHRLLENEGVTKTDGRITSITAENGVVFEGKIFADCSYEGDLMAKSGVKYFIGREAVDTYGESLAGVRDRTPKHQFPVNVKAHDESGRLLPEIQSGEKGEPGQGDDKVQAYNFRICMTKKQGNKAPFPKPPNYDPRRFELLGRLVNVWTEQEGQPPRVNQLMDPGPISGEKTDTNNNGAFSTDYIGGNYKYPDGTYAEREAIWQDHYEYVAGFLYYLANDPAVPQQLRDEMNTWGLAADEFQDTNHWPRQLYVREGRRMIGEYVMSQRDIQTERYKDDVIGMGSYNSDSHNVQRFVNADGFAENEGDMQVEVRPYQIPYRMILPRREQVQNLLVPVCFSASHVAYSTLRMEPQYMIIGQAAGVAASLTVKGGGAVQDVDSGALAARLRELNAVLELEDDSVAGHEDPRKIYGH